MYVKNIFLPEDESSIAELDAWTLYVSKGDGKPDVFEKNKWPQWIQRKI